jgi:hypothetical protein
VGANSKDVLPIEQELAAERAATLGRAGERFEAALRALADLDAAIGRAGPELAGALAARRPELRAEAAERLWFLIIQREVLGMGHHESVLQQYRVPPEIRRLAGPRRRR